MTNKEPCYRIRGPNRVVWLAVLLLARAAPAMTVNVVDQHGAALANAVVTATTVTGTHAPLTDATVAQVGQQFLPRVTAVSRGSRIHFPNRDTTQHHVYSFSAARTFEIELYKGDIPNPIAFDRAGIVALGCNIHDWMLGYIYVTDDDVYGVSDAAGRLQLQVAAGDLEQLTVWHPAAAATAPRILAAAAATSGDDGVLTLVIPTRDDDPLAFEIDPLQQLFQDATE